jgi:uncharacterized protein (TIGR03435 family)
MIRTILGTFAVLAGVAYAQTPVDNRFEVASVKPGSPDQSNNSSGIKSGKGRITASNVTLKRCIMGAYGLGPNQISGGPPWLESDRFEIVAKAAQPVDDPVLMAMLQNLLADRFKLAVHRETRAIPAYLLEVAKGGLKLQPSAGSDGDARTSSGHGRIDATSMTMNRFAEVLSRQMDLPVVNRTGIPGAFDLKLEWNPESTRPNASSVDNVPSIFTAIQEQLGLRLRSEKTPIEILVIDRAEKPAEN